MADAPIITDEANVRRERNRINRVAIYSVAALLIASCVWNIVDLSRETALGWDAVLLLWPLAIAYLIVRQLPRYADKSNG